MLPVIYGNSFQIVQAPGFVAIRYEMIHETRVVAMDGRPHVAPRLRTYMGDARGHWEGNTLVVETTNFTDKTSIGLNGNGLRHSTEMVMTERITRVGADELRYEVKINDPKTYAAPFGIPPFGSAALCAYRGDIVLARAAAAANVPMILSAASLIKLEDVKQANPAAWYQAYLAGDASRIEPLVDRVAAGGASRKVRRDAIDTIFALTSYAMFAMLRPGRSAEEVCRLIQSASRAAGDTSKLGGSSRYAPSARASAAVASPTTASIRATCQSAKGTPGRGKARCANSCRTCQRA